VERSPELYLASTSPRRSELLAQIGVQISIFSVDTDESPIVGEIPSAYVLRLAEAKAQAGWEYMVANRLPELPVLGADTTVVLGDRALGKPVNQEDCIQSLMSLSGRTHQVLTAVAIKKANVVVSELSVTNVTFKELTPDLLEQYWLTGEPQDKAGGYGIQGFGAVFVDKIEGSYSGVVGLPIEKTVLLLNQFNVGMWQNISNR